jgi:hypothetical protein
MLPHPESVARAPIRPARASIGPVVHHGSGNRVPSRAVADDGVHVGVGVGGVAAEGWHRNARGKEHAGLGHPPDSSQTDPDRVELAVLDPFALLCPPCSRRADAKMRQVRRGHVSRVWLCDREPLHAGRWSRHPRLSQSSRFAKGPMMGRPSQGAAPSRPCLPGSGSAAVDGAATPRRHGHSTHTPEASSSDHVHRDFHHEARRCPSAPPTRLGRNREQGRGRTAARGG